MARHPITVGSIIEPFVLDSAPMPLGTDYAGQTCSLARTLEVVGERWTLLILRDLFFGVRRFTDLQRHLDIPRAVLSARLAALVEDGVLERRPYRAGRDEFVLTADGEELWPAVHALMQWGERHHSPGGPRRVFTHVDCGGDLDEGGRCPACGLVPPARALVMRPGPGATPPRRDDAVTLALHVPGRLLEPLV
jgi:DNA-binding HxlR family transcriptional regulator